MGSCLSTELSRSLLLGLSPHLPCGAACRVHPGAWPAETRRPVSPRSEQGPPHCSCKTPPDSCLKERKAQREKIKIQRKIKAWIPHEHDLHRAVITVKTPHHRFPGAGVHLRGIGGAGRSSFPSLCLEKLEFQVLRRLRTESKEVPAQIVPVVGVLCP